MTKFAICTVIVAGLTAVAYSETQSGKDAVNATKPKPAAEAKPTAKDGLAASTASAPKKDGLAPSAASTPAKDPEKIDWKKVDWRKKLTRLQYYITREAGTERPFRNAYWNNFKDGAYKCVGCGLPLFESDSKFDAGCGWPSFDRVIAKNSVTEHEDHTLFTPRIEIRCRRCAAHLGHVFDDGPTETGLRYCMNSAAMSFVPAKKTKPKLKATAKAAPAASTTSNDGLAASAASDPANNADAKK